MELGGCEEASRILCGFGLIYECGGIGASPVVVRASDFLWGRYREGEGGRDGGGGGGHASEDGSYNM